VGVGVSRHAKQIHHETPTPLTHNMHKEGRKERGLYNFSKFGEDRAGVNSK